MFKLLKIISVAGLFCNLFAVQHSDNFKLSYPEFIPQGKSFQVSLITSAEYFDEDELELILVPSDGIELKSVSINSKNGLVKLQHKNINVLEFTADAQLININLNDSALTGNSFFQVLIELSSENVERSELHLSGILKNNQDTSGYLFNSDAAFDSGIPNYYRYKFTFYEPFKIADQCVKLVSNSSLSIPLKFKYKYKLFSEFWIKLEKSPLSFLQLKNISANRVEYQLSTNEFQILNVESNYNTQQQISPQFLSNKVWYHISVLFDEEKNLIHLYCNGNVFAVLNLPGHLTPADFTFEFSNAELNNSFSIEQFRLSDLEGDLDCILKSKNFISASCENAQTILQISFNENEIYSLHSDQLITHNNIRFTKSDAPLHPIVPELNVKILNNYFEIEFTGGDYKQASQYIVEKSGENHEFIPEHKIDADNKEKRVYSFISEKIEDVDLVYFRIRQINVDGTEIYSNQVKIGQGLIEDIILGQNYPNPFNPFTQIEFELLQDGDVEVVVYNLGGQEVVKLHKGFLSKGIYQFKFDGSELPSGIYLYKVSTALFTQTKKMILAK